VVAIVKAEGINMAAQYIRPTIADFEAQFSMPSRQDPDKRAFELVRPHGSEAYYLCRLKAGEAGTLCLKVLTSVAAEHASARGCGEDAIRVALYWQDANGWEKPLGKGKRVNRCGGAGKTAADVVGRALERAREVAQSRGKLPVCGRCGRPMVVRVAKSTGKPFYGCIGFSMSVCNGTDWNANPETDAAVREAVDAWTAARDRKDAEYEGHCDSMASMRAESYYN
jgi:hypothetical protein